MNSMKGRDVLTIRDLSIDEVSGLMTLAADIKKNPGAWKKALDVDPGNKELLKFLADKNITVK